MLEDRPEEAPSSSPLDHLRVVKADDIFKGEQVVLIDYSGNIYKLRITSQNKLILTKP